VESPRLRLLLLEVAKTLYGNRAPKDGVIIALEFYPLPWVPLATAICRDTLRILYRLFSYLSNSSIAEG